MSEAATAIAEIEPPAGAQERAEPLWAAVVSLALGVFGLVTAEFLPASLLTRMAADLNVTDGGAGQAVTATAIVGGVAGLTVAILTKTIDRRLGLWTPTLLPIPSTPIPAPAARLPILPASAVL